MGGERVTVRDWYIAYFPAPLTSYKLGDPLQPGSRVVVYRVLDALRSVLVRVTAVDAHGRMIATIGENVGLDTPLTGARAYNEDDATRSRVFPPRAITVTPQRPPPR